MNRHTESSVQPSASPERLEPLRTHCPSCGATDLTVFYEVEHVPVNSVLLLETRAEALNFPTGRIALGFCAECGFVSNLVFDFGRLEYSTRYESTQAYSPTFNAFAQRLATSLIERHDLHGKTLIEVGCGQGEFLALLCQLGENRGIGFDPAYIATGNPYAAQPELHFIADFYSEMYTHYTGDFLCCKMTLEHIHETADFVHTIRRAIGDSPRTVAFFQVPNLDYVLRETAFWDVYYEHCSYFSPGALARLFRRCGFHVTHLATEYDDQYLVVEATPSTGQLQAPLAQEETVAALRSRVDTFAHAVSEKLAHWRHTLQQFQRDGRRTVVWGGGSKAVSFFTTLNIRDEIPYAVDINPKKHGTYLPVTGQEVVAPDFLRDYRPDVVIVMNPIYSAEIQQMLDELGVCAELMTI